MAAFPSPRETSKLSLCAGQSACHRSAAAHQAQIRSCQIDSIGADPYPNVSQLMRPTEAVGSINGRLRLHEPCAYQLATTPANGSLET
jgi:hypothetical protein